MHTIKLSLLLFALAISAYLADAQTATPSTTLCGAVTLTTTSVCLTSTTGVVNQTGLYVDNEYMTVTLSGQQVLAASNTYVPVTRGNRAGAGPPSLHNNAAVVWIALTPGSSVVPGVNGFVYSTQLGDVGPCTRGQQTYLPHIWPDRAVKRDCNVAGAWVDYAPLSGLDQTSPTMVAVLSTTNGALSVSSGDYIISKAGVLADTLAAPTAGVMDGMVIRITSTTSNAHTITATTLFQTGGSGTPYTTATFAAQIGASITLRAYGGFWYVIQVQNVVLS